VAEVILIVADQMFPEAALPDGAFAARDADRAPALGLGNGVGEGDFDQPSAHRKIGVTGRQRPNRVDVIRQHHHGVDEKRGGVWVSRVASRNTSIWSVRKRRRRSNRLTVKNQHPPGTKARR
jgi:hypothetical protein